MIKTSATVEDTDLGMRDLVRRIQASADHVDIGIHADEGQKLVTIAAAHEFGATIKHPGGTSYGYATEEDRQRHKVSFLKKGAGVQVLGVTGPHEIKIPMRSYIRSTMDKNQEKYHQQATVFVKMIVDGTITKWEALERMGALIESDIKATIIAMKSPPLRPATIRRKKSSALLQDTGLLKNSVRYVVGTKEQEQPVMVTTATQRV
jgi:hypothetical protein